MSKLQSYASILSTANTFYYPIQLRFIGSMQMNPTDFVRTRINLRWLSRKSKPRWHVLICP